MSEDAEESRIAEDFAEGQKLFFELSKHLTTLSTAVVTALFVLGGDAFKDADSARGLIPPIFILLAVTVIASVLLMAVFSYAIQRSGRPGRCAEVLGWTLVVVSIVSFIGLISCLSVFAFQNT